MKKKCILFILFSLFLLTGCREKDTISSEDLNSVKSLLEESTKIENLNIDLITTIEEYNVTIKWESGNTDIISNTGVITTPLFDTEVNLQYSVLYQDIEKDTGTISLQVKGFKNEVINEFNTYLEKLPTTITNTNLDLIKTLSHGVVVKWVSSDSSIISTDGILTTPLESSVVTLSYNLILGETELLSSSIDITVTSNISTDLETINSWLISNIPTTIYDDIALPSYTEIPCTITYTSSNPSLLSNEGKYTAPLNNYENVEITYLITVDGYQKSNTIVIKVSKSNDEIANTEISNYWNSISSAIPTTIASSITLPTSDIYDIQISSSNEDVLSSTGVIGNYTSDTVVTLSFSITYLGITQKYTKDISVIIYEYDESLFDLVHSYIQENTPKTIIFDVSFPTTYLDTDVVISWQSENHNLLGDNGEYLAKSGTYDDVDLNYTIELYGKKSTGSILVTVIDMDVTEIANDFNMQFMTPITKDKIVETDFYDDFVITWSSSDEDIFSNEGIFTKPAKDSVLTINYTITFFDKSWDFQTQTRVKGIPIDERIDTITNWFLSDVLADSVILPGDELTLPTEYTPLDATIEWWCTNSNVINANGEIFHYAFDRYVDLIALIDFGDSSKEISFTVIVKAAELTTLEEKIDSYIKAIALDNISSINFSSGGVYTNITQSYNKLSFYNNEEISIVEQIAPINESNRPGTKLYSTEFVIVHDTANNGATANAKAHAGYVEGGGGGTSWHYTVDENGAYHQIPDDEVAYHAGSGSTAFNLINSNVKATKQIPVVTITSNGYYAFNGVASTISAPLIELKIPTTDKITPSGIYTTIINGYYYMNESYYNSGFALISNNGGNRNAIGIETCVNNGSDYIKTVHVNAKLVADLLIDNNLAVDRVMQHNHFSGKDCPGAIREKNYWSSFLDLVSLYKFAKENLTDVNFEWVSDCDILSDDGIISYDTLGQDSVKYHVNVSYSGIETTKNFVTLLK